MAFRHLIIGGGSIGKRHLRNLYFLGEHELYCLRRNPDPQFEKEFHCKVITKKEEAFLIKPDVVFVCNPTSLHSEALALAYETGAKVFMEKPLTHDKESLENIKKLPIYNKVFFIGFMLRYHPLVKIIKEKLEEEVIGKVFSTRFSFGSYLPFWHPWEDHRTGYAGRKDLGGGVINTISHELDLMLYFFGEPSAVVAAKMNIGHLDIDVEELSEAIFKYQWGFATLHLDYLQKDYDRQIIILGTEGKITWNWNEHKIIIEKHKSDKQIIEKKLDDVNQLYVDELKDFLELIRSGQTKHPLDFDYAIKNCEWILKMHKSSEKSELWEE